VIGLDVKNFGVALEVKSCAPNIQRYDLFRGAEVSVTKRSNQHMVFAVNNSEVVRVDKSRVRPPVADLACA
jgi:hypothetical protein